MVNQEKKAGDLSGSFSLLNQLITSLEEAESKFEDACKKDDSSQINLAKESILNLQKQISEELK